MMFLVIDINKGIQTQTAECLVLGEILLDNLVILLNKVDLIPKETRTEVLNKKISALRKVFSRTKFGGDVTMIPLAANPSEENPFGLEEIFSFLIKNIRIPKRNHYSKDSLLFLIDHCFPIKGKGSVVTGTIVSGSIGVSDEVEFPQISEKKKVKSIQMFHKPVQRGQTGDRVGVLFTQLDSTLIERGLACSPGSVKGVEVVVIDFNPVNYYKSTIKSKAKFHLTSGHQTCMASLILFEGNQGENYEFAKEYEYKELFDGSKNADNSKKLGESNDKKVYALLIFETPILISNNSLLLASKLDLDINAKQCRLAFYGNSLFFFDYNALPNIRIFKNKERLGSIDKVVDDYTIIMKEMFHKETDLNKFLGKSVYLESLEGKIQSNFGKSGKVKVSFTNPISSLSLSKEESKSEEIQESKISLKYQTFLFQKKKKIKNK